MPAEVRGALELRKAIKKFSPDLAKETRKELANVLAPIVKTARGFVPSTAPLSGWAKSSNTALWTEKGRLWNTAEAKGGIGYKTSPSKPNDRGFRAIARIANTSASGAIYETAGRKAGSAGNAGGRSNNPEASSQFIRRMGPLYGDKQPDKGRAIFRAWYEDKGKAQDAAFKAIEKTINGFNRGAYELAA